MPLEVELKFPIQNRQALLARCRDLDVQFDETQREIDQYFQHPCRDFGASDEAVRLRSIGENNRLTYKGPKLDAETKTRREVEFEIGAGLAARNSALQWLTALGFEPVAQVAKYRTSGHIRWEGHDVTIALDSVDGLGEYIELELLADESLFQVAKATLMSLAANLGLQHSERRGYLNMLLDRPRTPA